MSHVSHAAVWLSLPCQYNNGIPEGSRFDDHKEFFKDALKSLNEEEGRQKIEKVKALTQLAETGGDHVLLGGDHSSP